MFATVFLNKLRLPLILRIRSKKTVGVEKENFSVIVNGRVDHTQTLPLPAKRRIAYGLVGVFLSIFLSLGLVEAMLRIVNRPRGHMVGWKWKGNPQESNEFGLRGHRATKPVDTTVVLLGDSHVESRTSFDQMPEVYLAEALKQLTHRDVRVVSIGASGWGQDQQLLALRQYLPQIKPKPKMVCLWFTPDNDVWNNTFPTQFGFPKPTFWLENGKLKGPHAPWLKRYHRRSLYLLRLLDKVRGIRPWITDAEWEAKLPPPYRSSNASGKDIPSLLDFVVAKQPDLGAQDVKTVKKYFTALEHFGNEQTHLSIALYPRSPRLQYSARLTRTLLLEIWKYCKQNHVQFMVFKAARAACAYIPDEPTTFVANGKIVTLSNASARSLIDEILTGIPTLNITGFPGKDWSVSKTDRHLNGEGNKFWMTALAKWVVSMVDLRAYPKNRKSELVRDGFPQQVEASPDS